MRLAKPFDEATPPARVNWLPAELALGLSVGAAADLRHHRHAAIPDGDLAEPDWHLPRWLGAKDVRNERQPS